MSGELEPVSPDTFMYSVSFDTAESPDAVIEPTAVYGPDDWRPYTRGVDQDRLDADLVDVSALDTALRRFKAQARDDYADARRYQGMYLGVALNDAAIGERIRIEMRSRRG